MDPSQESTHSLERTVWQIMTDNGMSEDEADATIENMSRIDMERYLLDCHDDNSEE